MKLIGHISILLAGAILLLHSMLPHEHHTEFGQVQHIEAHETASSLFDYIKLAFHVDLGDEHLEDYEVTQQVSVNFDILLSAIIIFSFENDSTNEEESTFFIHKDELNDQFFGLHLSLRGPPQTA